MNIFLIIGNVISMVAAVFTILSSVSHGNKKIYGYQAVQCGIMSIASVFFASASGVTTFLLCTARNCLLMYDKFTKRLCVVFMVLVAVIGCVSNNRGIVGYIPVITTLIYTFGTLVCKKEGSIKINIIVNLVLWAVYDIIIYDFVTFVIDTISAIVTVVSLMIFFKKIKGAKSNEAE